MTDHDILIRMDEAVSYMKESLIPKILAHLEKINGTQVEHHGRISRVEMAIKIGGGCGGVGVITAIVLKILGIY